MGVSVTPSSCTETFPSQEKVKCIFLFQLKSIVVCVYFKIDFLIILSDYHSFISGIHSLH